jgi:hypothetical protein
MGVDSQNYHKLTGKGNLEDQDTMEQTILQKAYQN